MKIRQLYLAYGANTNLSSMAQRCPRARYIGPAELLDHTLVFRGVADVVRQPGAKVAVAMWDISMACEMALDKFEGVPTLYRKAYAEIELDGRSRDALFYVMVNRHDEAPAYGSYERLLRIGYAETGLPLSQIDRAMRRAAKHQRGPARPHRRYNPRKGSTMVVGGHDLLAMANEEARQEQQAAFVEGLQQKLFPHWAPKRIR